jgi:hypothetical protein
MIYVIFFHITGIAVIETLFYFYYIGPMEHKVFKNSLENSLDNSYIIKYIYNENIMNLTYLNFENILMQQNVTVNAVQYVENGKDSRNKYNENLFHFSLIALSVIISISIFVCIIENVFKYKTKELKRNRSSHNVIIEMSNFQEIQDNIQEEVIEVNDTLIFYIKSNYKIFLKSFGKVILMSSLLITFEYWFFNNIVLKYKIISKEEMEYLLLHGLEKSLLIS